MGAQSRRGRGSGGSRAQAGEVGGAEDGGQGEGAYGSPDAHRGGRRPHLPGLHARYSHAHGCAPAPRLSHPPPFCAYRPLRRPGPGLHLRPLPPNPFSYPSTHHPPVALLGLRRLRGSNRGQGVCQGVSDRPGARGGFGRGLTRERNGRYRETDVGDAETSRLVPAYCSGVCEQGRGSAGRT